MAGLVTDLPILTGIETPDGVTPYDGGDGVVYLWDGVRIAHCDRQSISHGLTQLRRAARPGRQHHKGMRHYGD